MENSSIKASIMSFTNTFTQKTSEPASELGIKSVKYLAAYVPTKTEVKTEDSLLTRTVSSVCDVLSSCLEGLWQGKRVVTDCIPRCNMFDSRAHYLTIDNEAIAETQETQEKLKTREQQENFYMSIFTDFIESYHNKILLDLGKKRQEEAQEIREQYKEKLGMIKGLLPRLSSETREALITKFGFGELLDEFDA